MKSYSERLKDPRWQRKRLDILQRADFSCEECGNSTKTLHVDHKIYRKGAMPWEYGDDELQALCVDCHTGITETRKQLNEALCLLANDEVERVLGYARMQAMFRRNSPKDPVLNVRESLAEDRLEVVTGMADGIFGDLPGDMLSLVDACNQKGFIERRRLVELRLERLKALGISDPATPEL